MILELAALSRLSGVPIFEVKTYYIKKIIKTMVVIYNIAYNVILLTGKSSQVNG